MVNAVVEMMVVTACMVILLCLRLIPTPSSSSAADYSHCKPPDMVLRSLPALKLALKRDYVGSIPAPSFNLQDGVYTVQRLWNRRERATYCRGGGDGGPLSAGPRGRS